MVAVSPDPAVRTDLDLEALFACIGEVTETEFVETTGLRPFD